MRCQLRIDARLQLALELLLQLGAKMLQPLGDGLLVEMGFDDGRPAALFFELFLQLGALGIDLQPRRVEPEFGAAVFEARGLLALHLLARTVELVLEFLFVEAEPRGRNPLPFRARMRFAGDDIVIFDDRIGRRFLDRARRGDHRNVGRKIGFRGPLSRPHPRTPRCQRHGDENARRGEPADLILLHRAAEDREEQERGQDHGRERANPA